MRTPGILIQHAVSAGLQPCAKNRGQVRAAYRQAIPGPSRIASRGVHGTGYATEHPPGGTTDPISPSGIARIILLSRSEGARPAAASLTFSAKSAPFSAPGVSTA